MNILSDKNIKQDGNPKLAQHEISRYQMLLSERQSKFDSPWQKISDLFYPNLSDIQGEKTEGTTGWSDGIYDTTALDAARTCSTGLTSLTTPSVEPWFRWLPPQDLELDEYDDGSIWCGKATEIHLNEFARSNYYTVSGEANHSRTVFGTGPTFIDEGKEVFINARTFKIGTYCIDENDEGKIDTFYVAFKMTARQCVQAFGLENLPPKIRQAYEESKGKKMDKKWEILHAIRPRDEVERILGLRTPENLPFADIYISMEDKLVIKEGGFDEFPVSVSRFDSWGTGTPWGYSPAYMVYKLTCQLNYMTKFLDTIPELRANPRFLVPVGMQGQMDLRPGGFTVYNPTDPGGGKPEEWMTQADFKMGEFSISQKQEMIKKAFFNDVFTMFNDIQGQKTAYEISLRESERIQQLSPTFGRLLTEKNGPDLKRSFGMLFRAGKFPPVPDSMIRRDPRTGKPMGIAMPEISYSSQLALKLKELQNRATKDSMQFLIGMATQAERPEIYDNFDLDLMSRDVAMNGGMPAKYQRPMKEVEEIRQAKQQQIAQQQALQAGEQASNMAAKLGKAPKEMQEQMSA